MRDLTIVKREPVIISTQFPIKNNFDKVTYDISKFVIIVDDVKEYLNKQPLIVKDLYYFHSLYIKNENDFLYYFTLCLPKEFTKYDSSLAALDELDLINKYVNTEKLKRSEKPLNKENLELFKKNNFNGLDEFLYENYIIPQNPCSTISIGITKNIERPYFIRYTYIPFYGRYNTINSTFKTYEEAIENMNEYLK